MVDDEDYELLPHEEIQKLRDELNKLKKNPLGSTVQAKDLQTSVTELTKAINSLTTLLKDTNDDMIQEFQRNSISGHFEQISTQNEQIAQGILTVAQMLQQMSSPQKPEKPVQNNSSIVQESTASSQGFQPVGQSPVSSSFHESQPYSQPSMSPPVSSPSQPVTSSTSSLSMQGTPPPMSSSKSDGSPLPPPALDLPPAPAKKKSGILGMFK